MSVQVHCYYDAINKVLICSVMYVADSLNSISKIILLI